MASKIEGRSFDAPIKSYNFDGHDYNTLRVHVDYDKAGWQGGYFSATLTPEYIEVHNGYQTRGFHVTGTRDPLGSWMTIRVKDAPKNSQKTIVEISAALEQAKDAIAYYFDQRNWVRLQWLVESVGRSGYTPTIADLVKGDMEKTNDNSNNLNNSETMATNAKGADLIGKTIVVNGSDVKYVIKSVDGDKLMTDFIMGDRTMPCPVPMEQVTKMIDAGTWKLEDGNATAEEEPAATTTEEPTATADEVEEVVDEPIEEPAAETVRIKTEMPKDKAEEKGTAKPKVKPVGGSRGQAPDSSQATHQGASPHDAASRKLRYETYTTKRGKTGAKIVGFHETDAAYLAGPDLHGSKAWENDKQGNKTFCLLFSHRYAKAAKDVCEALNKGKSVADCQAIIDGCTEERAQRREEWRQKRAERDNATTNEGEATATTENAEGVASDKRERSGKLYTEAEVRKAFATLAEASGVDVKEFEPIIEAMKAAA